MDITRTVRFDLTPPLNQKEISIALLLARSYYKSDIVACFEELEKNGFGKFDRGSHGKGNFGKFIPNETAPKIYDMIFVVKKKGRPKKYIEG